MGGWEGQGRGAGLGAQGEAGLLGPVPPPPAAPLARWPASQPLPGPRAHARGCGMAPNPARGHSWQSCCGAGIFTALAPFVPMGRLRLAEARGFAQDHTARQPRLSTPQPASPPTPAGGRDHRRGRVGGARGPQDTRGRWETEAAHGRGRGLLVGHASPHPWLQPAKWEWGGRGGVSITAAECAPGWGA